MAESKHQHIQSETESVKVQTEIAEAVKTQTDDTRYAKIQSSINGSGMTEKSIFKDQEPSQQTMHKDESKGTLPSLPAINLTELTTILLDPNMPSQKIMKEVADKIILKSEESESDDASVYSNFGMKGVLDCIFEVSFMHSDSDSSDDDETFERIPHEIHCTFCNKIFGSTMRRNTHVLVAHSQQEPSVLNIKKISSNEGDQKDKGHSSHKKHLVRRSLSKADRESKEQRGHYLVTDVKQATELSQGEENRPVNKRRASFSRSQQKEAPGSKSEEKKKKDRIQSKSSPDCLSEAKEVQSSSKASEDADPCTSLDKNIDETHSKHGVDEKVKMPEKSQLTEPVGRKVSDLKHKSQESVTADPDEHTQSLTSEGNVTEDSPPGKRRRISSLLQAASSSSKSTSSNRNSRKSLKKEIVHKHVERSVEADSRKDEQCQGERVRKVPVRKSSRRL